MQAYIDQWKQMGDQWVKGEIRFSEFDTGEKRIKLNAKQKEFVNALKPTHLLLSGGYAGGKTTAFLVKLWLLCMCFPNSRILLGRKTLKNIEQALLPDLFDIFPKGSYEYKAGPGLIKIVNGSEIILKGLDVMTGGTEKETKKSMQDIKGLSLSGVFIDQLEEIDFSIYEALSGRLRKNDVPVHQFNSTTNPANYWARKFFISEPRENTRLIKTSMFDNADNLPKGYIDDQIANHGELYRKIYVEGEWDLDLLLEGSVFSSEVYNAQKNFIRPPKRELDGIKIFEEPTDEIYQIGVDPSVGSVDPCSIKVVSKTSGREVASYSAFVPTEVIADKAVLLANMYSMLRPTLIVPEATGIGQALIEALKKRYEHIYVRESFNYRTNKKTQKLGFYTNFQTKNQLIENMTSLLNKNFVKISDQQTLNELKVFQYTDEAKKSGAGAPSNEHDDNLMALMLAFWNVDPVTDKVDKVKEELRRAQNEFKRRLKVRNPAR